MTIDQRATDEKPTNPKHNFGVNKVPLSAVPLPALMELALVMHHGSMKYGRHNYREAGVNTSIYFDAAIRHLFAWFEGQDEDPDSGCHPLAHVMACCAIVIDGEWMENLRDDRPVRLPDYDVLIESFNAMAKTMTEEGRERDYKFPPPATEVEYQETLGRAEDAAHGREVVQDAPSVSETPYEPLVEEENIDGVFRPALHFSKAALAAAKHPVIDNRKTSQ